MLSPPVSDKGAPAARSLRVAIVGGGITGVTLALGLQARGVAYTLYERAPEFREIGAGVGFSPNAEAALHRLDPAVHAAYKRVATANGEDYFQWVDGRTTDDIIFKLYLGKDGFQGCRRSDFLDELVSMLKPKCVRLGKAAVDVNETENGGVSITFGDGTVEEADIGKWI
jgi:salicylate hydroxylase